KVFRIIRPHEPLHEIYDGVEADGKRALGKFKLKPRAPELVAMQRLRSIGGRFAKQTYDGVCFYTGINQLSNASRGLSDFFPVVDFLTKLDGAVFDTAERAQILRMLALDIEAEGVTDEKELRKLQDTVRAAFMKYCGTFTHNEKVKVTPSVPDLKSADMRELVKIVLLHVLGAFGMPLHWFADGGEANLATAGEMGGPTIRKLQSVQTEARMMLRSICDFQIALKLALAIHEIGEEGAAAEYTILLPEIVSKDTAREANSLAQLVVSVTQLVDDGYLTGKTAGIWLHNKATQILGEEIRDEDRELLDELDQEEDELEFEPRPGDDGLEPDDEIDQDDNGESNAFEQNKRKPLTPEMKARADALKKTRKR
ncbi:MAG: hypothetical protein ACYS5V_10365, partial [Planctomycetota bacterium]